MKKSLLILSGVCLLALSVASMNAQCAENEDPSLNGVAAYTLSQLLDKDAEKAQEESAKKVGNTLRLLSAKERYEECSRKKGASACQKELDAAYEEAKKARYKADSNQALKELSYEYDRCMKESTGASAMKGKDTYTSEKESYCKMKYKESLNKYGLTADAEAVNMTAEETKEAREVQAEQDYDKCMQETKNEEKCTKQYNDAYEKAKMDYLKEKPEQAARYAADEYDKCLSENPVTGGEAYCRSKTKETLEKAGLNAQANDIQITPSDTRATKEIQAQKDYDACLKEGKSDIICQKKYVQATEAAKVEYYRTEPDKAREEIDGEYWKCLGSGEGIASEQAKCNTQRETMLKRSGLIVGEPISPKQSNTDDHSYYNKMLAESLVPPKEPIQPTGTPEQIADHYTNETIALSGGVSTKDNGDNGDPDETEIIDTTAAFIQMEGMN